MADHCVVVFSDRRTITKIPAVVQDWAGAGVGKADFNLSAGVVTCEHIGIAGNDRLACWIDADLTYDGTIATRTIIGHGHIVGAIGQWAIGDVGVVKGRGCSGLIKDLHRAAIAKVKCPCVNRASKQIFCHNRDRQRGCPIRGHHCEGSRRLRRV